MRKLTKTIVEAEKVISNHIANNQIQPIFKNKYYGFLVEAIPEGYKIFKANTEEEFLSSIQQPKIRHWA